MRSLYVHFFWSLTLFIISLFRFVVISLNFYFLSSIFISFSIFRFWNLSFSLIFSIDWISISFISCVSLISRVIYFYSYNYISSYTKSYYFTWLTIGFVFSMFIIILMSDLFFCMLGWDGLGLMSFLLIAYYQNVNSIFNRIYTLLINRIGDCFFIISIVVCFRFSDRLNFITLSHSELNLISLILLLTFITKRALYPFSFWLPLAISAPTPISALVHSSTLVTSGLYLIIRFYNLFYINSLIINSLPL